MTARAVVFAVEGAPVPQGSKGVTMRGGKPQLFETNATELRRWRRAIRDAALAHRVTWILQSPLAVSLVFHLPTPKRAMPGDPCATKPDIDKLTRAVLDGLVDGHVLIDDAQVVRLVVEKRFGDPGVSIHVTDATTRRPSPCLH